MKAVGKTIKYGKGNEHLEKYISSVKIEGRKENQKYY